MKRVSFQWVVVLLIFLQLGSGPGLDPRDPFGEYEHDSEPMQIGAGIGAATYLVSKLLGQTIGDNEVVTAIRSNAPFMSLFLPPKGWKGWKEEVMDLLGYATLGAGVGAFASGGELAQQFQFGLMDAISHQLLMEVADLIRGEDIDHPPFIDVVMVKTASQIIRDQLMPGGLPVFRGKSREVLILNGAYEVTAMAFIGVLEGAVLATMNTYLRKGSMPLKDALKEETIMHASSRGLQALGTIVLMGPRIHVSKSEKRKINAYAMARGIDIRWALDHAEFRDIKYAGGRGQGGETNKRTVAFSYERHVVLPHGFDPRNNDYDQYLAIHELIHTEQFASTPNWIYLHIRYPEFRKSARHRFHDSRITEQFPSSFRPRPPEAEEVYDEVITDLIDKSKNLSND